WPRAPARGQSPSAQRAAEPREEMAARTCPRAKPIGTEGGGAAGGDGRAHLPEGKAHPRSRRARTVTPIQLVSSQPSSDWAPALTTIKSIYTLA
ncbi:MAG: hypothetical protein WAV47_04825, partial [Blastocatellia bacterium]